MSIYDYIAIGWFIFVLLLLFVLILLLARKKPKLAAWLALLSTILIIVAPFGIKYFLDQSVRKVEVLTQKVVKLNFANSLVVSGKIINEGNVDFHSCKIDAKVIRYDPNKFKFAINSLKPIRSISKIIDKNLTIGDTIPFKMVFENFNYKGDFNITLEGVCY